VSRVELCSGAAVSNLGMDRRVIDDISLELRPLAQSQPPLQRYYANLNYNDFAPFSFPLAQGPNRCSWCSCVPGRNERGQLAPRIRTEYKRFMVIVHKTAQFFRLVC